MIIVIIRVLIRASGQILLVRRYSLTPMNAAMARIGTKGIIRMGISAMAEGRRASTPLASESSAAQSVF